jgi:hypothetical protein
MVLSHSFCSLNPKIWVICLVSYHVNHLKTNMSSFGTYIFMPVESNQRYWKKSVILIHMLCDTVLHGQLSSFVYSEKRLVPMYTKHEKAKHFGSVVSIILKANLWTCLCTELKLSPRFSQRHMGARLYLSKVTIEKPLMWENVLMFSIVNVCFVTFPLADMCASTYWYTHPSL